MHEGFPAPPDTQAQLAADMQANMAIIRGASASVNAARDLREERLIAADVARVANANGGVVPEGYVGELPPTYNRAAPLIPERPRPTHSVTIPILPKRAWEKIGPIPVPVGRRYATKAEGKNVILGSHSAPRVVHVTRAELRERRGGETSPPARHALLGQLALDLSEGAGALATIHRSDVSDFRPKPTTTSSEGPARHRRGRGPRGRDDVRSHRAPGRWRRG